jgi:hypothetical protein
MKTERTPDEMLAHIRETWQRIRTYERWPVIYTRLRDEIIEVMSATHTPILATAAALYSIGLAKGDEAAECWLAVGWEMQVRMAARLGSCVGNGHDVGVDEPRLKAAPLAVVAARDGSVLLREIGGKWAIGRDGRLIDL